MVDASESPQGGGGLRDPRMGQGELRPTIILPLLVGASLLAALLAFADVKKVAALMTAFDKLYFLSVLLLMAAYTTVRGAQ